MTVFNKESRNGNGRALELGHHGWLDNRLSDTRLVVLHAKPDGERWQEEQEEVVTKLYIFPSSVISAIARVIQHDGAHWPSERAAIRVIQQQGRWAG
jgi:hypothetical protein